MSGNEDLRAALNEINPNVDGLVSPCRLCGKVPELDYIVDDAFWQNAVPKHLRAGVLCLPCLSERTGDVALSHVRLLYLTSGGVTRAFLPAGVAASALSRLGETRMAMTKALGRVTTIGIAVDSVMADRANEKEAELVPSIIGQWAEDAADYLRAALAGEEKTK